MLGQRAPGVGIPKDDAPTVMPSIRTLAFAGLLGLLTACSGAGVGSPAAPSETPIEFSPRVSATPASTAPSQPPEASEGAAAIATAEDAVAAVVAEQPQFAGYPVVAPLVGASATPVSPIRPIGGSERSVLVEQLPSGFRLTFVTGSGDCPAGCTDHRYDVFMVATDGAVKKACVLDRFPVGREDPCARG